MKMCENNIPLIHMLVEGELDPRATEQLAAHLADCPRCCTRRDAFVRMKTLIESGLETAVPCQDSTAEVMARVSQTDSAPQPRRRATRFLRKAAIAAAACLATILLAGYLFVHFYFHRTFPHQLDKMVTRCSSGIERKGPGAEWQRLRVGDRLEKDTLIRAPGGARSFMSFDGIRLLTDDKAEFAATDRRAFSLQQGNVFVASAERGRPVTIQIGSASLRTDDGAFKLSHSNSALSVGVASGTVDLTTPDGKTHSVAADQIATVQNDGSAFELAGGKVANPFARLKISVLDRIKTRFAEVMSNYIPRLPMAGYPGRGFAQPALLRPLSGPDGMYRFASYDRSASYTFAQAAASTLNDYYESLFGPSNRSLSIGKQRLAFLEPGNSASHPSWSHDGSMIAYSEFDPRWWPTVVKVARIDDLEHPWIVSQEYNTTLPMFPLAWAPDNRHVLFMVADHVEEFSKGKYSWYWHGPYKIKIAPIDPAEGPIRDFESPFYDIPLELPVPIGKTISPKILKLPWGDAVLCANWGNIGYIPLEPDGQAVQDAPGVFLTNFNPRDVFVAAAKWSPSGSKIVFMAGRNLELIPNIYILYDVEDILDGFTQPPRSIDDPRIKYVAPSKNAQYYGGFSFDESLVFYQEDVSGVWTGEFPMSYGNTDFDLFYANALRDEPSRPTQIHLPGTQQFTTVSPEGNRIAYCNFDKSKYELRIVNFDTEADIDVDLGGVLIDNSGTNLIVPPGALEKNFKVVMSTPFDIGEEAEIQVGESHFFAMRLIDAEGLEKPKFIEPMTLTIRYTEDDVAGLDEGMLELYYYDESDPEHPAWVPLGGTVDPDHNEITVEIRHFSKFSVGGKPLD